MLPDPTTFETLSADRRALWDRYLDNDKVLFTKYVGLILDDVRLDYCRLRLPSRPELLQAGGAVHGGVVATLIDTACVPAVGSGFETGRCLAPRLVVSLPPATRSALARDLLRRRERDSRRYRGHGVPLRRLHGHGHGHGRGHGRGQRQSLRQGLA